jgi:hypothetical protein
LFLHSSLGGVPGAWEQECTIVVVQSNRDKALAAKKKGDIKVGPGDRVSQYNGSQWKSHCWKCCVGNTMTCANYKDLLGRQACARHARKDGTHVKQALCAKCRVHDVATSSRYKDAQGRHACARHALEDGTHMPVRMCVKCSDLNIVTESSYKDGKGRHACARHAREEGTYAKQNRR